MNWTDFCSKELEMGGRGGVCSLLEGRKNEWESKSASDVSGDDVTTDSERYESTHM